MKLAIRPTPARPEGTARPERPSEPARHRVPVRTRVSAVSVSLVAALATVTAVAAVPFAAQQAQAAPPAFCSLTGTGLVTNTWTGAGGDGQWVTAANWSRGKVPGNLDGASGYVCIGASATVTMKAGESANLQAIDIDAGARLNLTAGAKLFVLGNQSTRPSYIRSGATLSNVSATVGGSGKYVLDGTLFWTSTSSGAAAMSTRRCYDVGVSCSATPSTKGLLEVGNQGKVYVNGNGVNLDDHYRLFVRGLLRLTNSGYVAADDGTRINIAVKDGTTGTGEFLVTNDGGWYQGNLNPALGLSVFVNNGVVRKSGGTGTSVIDAAYSQGNQGSVRVQSGRLSLPPTWSTFAVAAGSASVGFGTCVSTGTYACLPDATSSEPQNGSLRVPASDTTGATVRLNLDGAGPAGTLGQQVHAAASALTATKADPAVMELRYDASILAGKTASTITIQRQPEVGGAFVTVPNCLSTGAAPAGSVACVDRRGIAGVSSRMDGGDAIMVVRTTGFSRWVAL